MSKLAKESLKRKLARMPEWQVKERFEKLGKPPVVKQRRAPRFCRGERTQEECKAKGKWNIFELCRQFPGPKYDPDPAVRATWQNKNGYGLKLYRNTWRYPEPCYWTITKVKQSVRGCKPKAWGIQTWRGKVVNPDKQKKIPSTFKRTWRILEDESKWQEEPHIQKFLEQYELERNLIWHRNIMETSEKPQEEQELQAEGESSA